MKILNEQAIFLSDRVPFDHWIIDDFFEASLAKALEAEFPPYDSSSYHEYNNPIERKKTCNNWNLLPRLCYLVLHYLTSDKFLNRLTDIVRFQVLPDHGLHGGGLHIHEAGGLLNPHLDYSIHPKLGLQRKLNLIVYLAGNLEEEYGGHLGLWSNQEATQNPAPAKLIKEVFPQHNRAIIFDTTQNSWHGISRPFHAPQGIYRKSLATYYLIQPPEDASTRSRALFAPVGKQKHDSRVLDLIQKRASEDNHANVYRAK